MSKVDLTTLLRFLPEFHDVGAFYAEMDDNEVVTLYTIEGVPFRRLSFDEFKELPTWELTKTG